MDNLRCSHVTSQFIYLIKKIFIAIFTLLRWSGKIPIYLKGKEGRKDGKKEKADHQAENMSSTIQILVSCKNNFIPLEI